MTRQACSSATCPGGSTTPTGLSIALWLLPQWNDIGGRLGESLPRDFDPMLDTCEYRRLILEWVASLHTQDESGAAFCARMLGEQKNAGLSPFRSRPISEPRRQWYTRCMLQSYASQVQDDCAEAPSLQQKVGHAKSLADPGQRLWREPPGLSF